MMRDTSSRSSTICVSEVALRSMVSSARCRLSGATLPGAQHARVAEDRVQRRAQLVRERRQKFVLQAARLLGIHIETRILERDRGP